MAAKAAANTAAIRHTVHQVDVVADELNNQREDVVELSRQMLTLLQKQTTSVGWIRWQRLRRRLHAMSAVMAGLLQGQVPHRIVWLTDLAAEWRQFSKKMTAGGWTAAVTDLHQLFGCPITVWTEEPETIVLAIHLPLWRPSAQQYWRFRPSWLCLLYTSPSPRDS